MARVNNSIKIVSYNCFSIRRRVDIVRGFLKNCDLLLCQEMVLLHENCNILSSFDENFYVLYLACKTADSSSDEGRPIGGFALFYRKSFNLKIESAVPCENFSCYRVTREI